jgi:hypothetical protein
VVRLEEIEVDAAERLRRDRLSLLGQSMSLQFVVRKQALSVERADDVVDGVL